MIFFLPYILGWAIRYSACNMDQGLYTRHINGPGPCPGTAQLCKGDRQVNKYLPGWETLALIKNTWQEQGTSSPRDPAKEEKRQTIAKYYTDFKSLLIPINTAQTLRQEPFVHCLYAWVAEVHKWGTLGRVSDAGHFYFKRGFTDEVLHSCLFIIWCLQKPQWSHHESPINNNLLSTKCFWFLCHLLNPSLTEVDLRRS